MRTNLLYDRKRTTNLIRPITNILGVGLLKEKLFSLSIRTLLYLGVKMKFMFLFQADHKPYIKNKNK